MSGRWASSTIWCILTLGTLTLSAACGASDDGPEPLQPAEDSTGTVVDEPTPETITTTEAATETTLSDLAVAEIDIKAVIQAWWTYARDTSRGEAGLPLEFLTGLMYQRVEELGATREAEGLIQRSQGSAAIRVIDMTIDIRAGTAEANVCSLGDAELVDAETGEVLAVDEDQAYTGIVFAKEIDGEWKLSEFVTSQAGENPERCDI